MALSTTRFLNTNYAIGSAIRTATLTYTSVSSNGTVGGSTLTISDAGVNMFTSNVLPGWTVTGTGVPAGTVVTNVPTGSTVTVNKTVPAGAISGGIVITQVVPADALHPASNALTSDRYVVWSTPATGNTVSIYLNIGNGKTISVVGLLGWYSAGYPIVCNIFGGNTFPQDSSWVQVAALSVSLGTRDIVNVLSANVGYRYWGFVFPQNQSSGFALGKFLIGNFIGTDLGIVYGPGSTDTFIRQRVRNTSVGGFDTITETGLPRRQLAYKFKSVPQATLTTLQAVAAKTPWFLLDAFNRPFEVELSQDNLQATHNWGSPDLYDVEIDLDTLP